MRFSKLSLERYGRFEDCDLEFRDTQPDLHVVYGPNEAGKTTSLAAVSDLLFGFPARSAYNFRFDYPLLRVGAILEEDGRLLACRRRKAGGSTLVDANDLPIDEGGLLSMLKGQSRDTFRLSFSLDQDGLRRGGRAMVEAKNDVGQTLFAAGSGLTGISDELKCIEDEADAIWGKRAKASRTYTQAERELEASVRTIRDEGLKPKAWTDAKKVLETAKAKLDELEEQRDALQLESRRAERIRRIAGGVRLRTDLLQRIEEGAGTVELAPQVETAAETAMADAQAATRARAAAEKLHAEVEERASELVADPSVLDEAVAIEQLFADSGAVAKAARDLVRLEGERTAADANLKRLRERAGIDGGATLSSATVAKLRELARSHAEGASALRQIAKTEADLEARRKPLADKLNGEKVDEGLADLVFAVDEARKLGADADARCSKARKLANDARGEVETAVARLKPWFGSIDDLRTLPIIGSAEIEDVKGAWAYQRSAIERDEDEARRLDDEAAKLRLQIAGLTTGAAISEEELVESRRLRDENWTPLRAHILDAKPLDDASRATLTFEGAMASTDGLADRRFALADASGRLATLETALAARELETGQARGRSKHAADRFAELRRDWEARLESLALPNFEPIQLKTWLEGRDNAIEAEEEHVRLAGEADELESRRTTVVKDLRARLGELAPNDNDTLAYILAKAERARSDSEERDEQLRLDRENCRQLGDDIAAQMRSRKSVEADAKTYIEQWEQALAGSGIILDIASADARLALIDDVRQAEEKLEELSGRIDGIKRDAQRFGEDLKEVVDRLDVVTTVESDILPTLRARLEKGQTTKRLLDEIEKDKSKRQAEAHEAGAEYDAAMAVITPLLTETAAADVSELSLAIERSRSIRDTRRSLADVETEIVRGGDGLPLDDLVDMVVESDSDQLSSRTEIIGRELQQLNADISEAAKSHGDASRIFADLEDAPGAAADAASDAEQARAEMAVQAEAYILKRAQALTLRWAIEQYRERHQDPLLVRASELFSTLTLGRYSALRVELDDSTPHLIGISNDGRAAVEVDAMSEGTTDQLFLALRLAAVEQSISAGIRLPFLADDLFVNFDDERAEAGFRVLAALAQKTQVLFFTHHPHLAAIARSVVGDNTYSECALI